MGKTHKKQNYSAKKTEKNIAKSERKRVREQIKDDNFDDLPDYTNKIKGIKDELK